MADGFQPFPIGQVPQIDASNLTNAIGQAIQRRRVNSALQQLMSAGNDSQAQQSALVGLMQAGGPQVAAQAATAIRALKGPQLTPGEILAHEDRVARFKAEFPGAADPGGPAGTQPGATAQPRQTTAEMPEMPFPKPANKWQEQANQAALRAWGTELAKRPSAEDAGARVQILNQQLELFHNNAQGIHDDKNLPYVTGRYAMAPEAVQQTYQFAYPEVANTKANIKSLIAQARSNIMQMYKDLGGGKSGFGRVLLQEWANFGDVIAPLETAQTTDAYKKNLEKVITFAKESQDRVNAAYAKEYGGSQTPQASPQTTEDRPVPGATVETTAPKGMGTMTEATPKNISETDRAIMDRARQMRKNGVSQTDVIKWLESQGYDVKNVPKP